MSVFLMGVNIWLTSEGLEKTSVTLVLIVFLLLAILIIVPRPERPIPVQLAIGMWVIYKVMFVFGLSLLITPVGQWVKAGLHLP